MANQESRYTPSFTFMALTFIAWIVVFSTAKQHFGDGPAIGLSCCLISLIFAANVRWDLRGRWWFWFALCVSGALQLPLALFLPWSRPHLNGPGAMVFVLPCFLIACGCIALAEKVWSAA